MKKKKIVDDDDDDFIFSRWSFKVPSSGQAESILIQSQPGEKRAMIMFSPRKLGGTWMMWERLAKARRLAAAAAGEF